MEIINDAIRININDNVCIALKELVKNETIKVVTINEVKLILLIDDVSFGHKIALKNIKKGDKILKYGEIIGEASEDISKGSLVHSHNLISSYKKYVGKLI